MELFRFAMLLLVQLSPMFVHGNVEAVYKCSGTQTTDVTVRDASAQLTKGCVLNGKGITFDLEAMYKAAASKTPKTPVVIDISEADFTNSYIKLINAHRIPADISAHVPLLFTMSKSKMSGTSKLEFGDKGQPFNLPPNSRIRIIDSKLTTSSNTASAELYLFTFHSLQLVTNSTMEIAHNVITMEYKGDTMAVFYLPEGPGMKVSDKSSFTVRDNKITMTGHTSEKEDESKDLDQYVWHQGTALSLTISQTSTYTWASNIISMVGYNIKVLFQYVCYIYIESPLTVSDSSTYTWASNKISMVGYKVNHRLEQYVWFQTSTSPLTISQTGKYTWLKNSISMDGHDVDAMYQYVWFAHSLVAISALSQFLFESNKILLLARNYAPATDVWSYVMAIRSTFRPPISRSTAGTISGGSSMVWRDNCVGMGHKKTDKRHLFAGKWSIDDVESKMLLDGNNFTTTDEYEPSGDGLTQLVWGTKGDTDITSTNPSALTIRNTEVHANSAASGATGSMVWKGSLFTSKAGVKQPTMEWSSSTAKDGSGALIPTLDNSNVGKYMCNPLPSIPPTPTKTTPKVKSAAVILSTIPGVLITSVVFLCLYN